MDIKELRKGNYVKDTSTGRVGRLTSFNNNIIRLKMKKSTLIFKRNKGTSVESFYTEISPVKITENLLNQLEFSRWEDDLNEAIIWSRDELRLYQGNWDGNNREEIFSYATRTKGDAFKDGFIVSDLHRLQNMYFYLSISFGELTLPSL